VTFEVEMPVRV